MNYEEVMSELEKMGTAQNRKIFARHGASENMYGVSTANLKKLQKKIKVNHELATKLWESGNLDAQILATMIASPDELTMKQSEKWFQSIDDGHMMYSYLAGLIAKTRFAKKLMAKYMKSKKEFHRQFGEICAEGNQRNLSTKSAKSVPEEIRQI